MAVNEQQRAIMPFLQRAQELESNEPKVAYYCRLYAVETGLRFKQRTPAVDKLLAALVSKLEGDKAVVGAGDRSNDADYCRAFAEEVFSRADRTDRAGRANKSTAVTFAAATLFFDILRQFGPLPPELEDMQRYAAYKAADINKAVREGRTPTPGNGAVNALDLNSPAQSAEPLSDDAHPEQSHSQGAQGQPDHRGESSRASGTEMPRVQSSVHHTHTPQLQDLASEASYGIADDRSESFPAPTSTSFSLGGSPCILAFP